MNRLTKNIAQITPGTLFIGIDVGKKRHQVTIMTEKAKVVARFGIDATREGFDRLVNEALSHKERLRGSALLFGSEPAGHYWRPLAYYLEGKGYTFKLVNSFSVKRYREGMDLARIKNDRRDADTVADMLRSGRFIQTVLPYGVHAELRRTYRHYCRLRAELTQKRNLLIAAVDSLFPEYRRVFKDILGKTSIATLRACPAPAIIRRLTAEEWESLVRSHYQGKAFRERKKVNLLYELSQDSVGIPVEGQSLHREISMLVESISYVGAQMQALERDLLFHLDKVNGHELLLAIRGIGIITAAGILAEIGDIQRFGRIKGPVKLAGINPTEKQSCEYRGRSVMTKKGQALLRCALYSAAVGLVLNNKAFHEYYYSLRKREVRPLSRMKAIGAVMNKLLRVVYAILKKREPFDEAKVFPKSEQKEVVLQIA